MLRQPAEYTRRPLFEPGQHEQTLTQPSPTVDPALGRHPLAQLHRRRRGQRGVLRLRRPAAPAGISFPGTAISRELGYSAGFFMFWAVTALSSAVTWYLQRPMPSDDDDELPLG